MRSYSGVAVLSILLILVLGLLLLALPTTAETILTTVRYDPFRIDLSEPIPLYVNATISSRDSLWNASEVDPTSILMEGTLLQLLGNINVKFNDYIAVFDGHSVVNIIWQKLYHMGVVDPTVHRPFKVDLTITGKLNNGTPFQGTGTIMVKMFSSTPPPPPGI